MLTTPGRQALMQATMDRYKQCERGGDTSCILDYLCIKESIMVGFTQCENWNRFSTLSSSQAPHSANQIKTLETLWKKTPKPSHNETSQVMKENHEGRSSLVQWETEALTGCSLCRETLRSCSFQIRQILLWQPRELCFPSPGNYAAAILPQRCSTGACDLRVSRADFLIGYCMLMQGLRVASQTHSHDFKKRCADMLAVSCCVTGTKETMKMDSDTPGINDFSQKWQTKKQVLDSLLHLLMTGPSISLNSHSKYSLTTIINNDSLKCTFFYH